MFPDIVEAHGRVGDARRVAMQRRIGQLGDETPRQYQAAGADDDDGCHGGARSDEHHREIGCGVVAEVAQCGDALGPEGRPLDQACAIEPCALRQ